MVRKYKMSSVQRRMYAIDKMQEANISYNIPMIFSIDGEIDIHKLKNSLEKVYIRHDIFRTRFEEKDEKYFQIIEDTPVIDFQYLDSVSEGEKIRLFKEFIQPFDLNKLPLIRVKVIETVDIKRYLLIDVHHIIFDGGSMIPFFRELNNIYTGCSLDPIKFQYIHYMEWERTRNLEKQEQYWINEFSNQNETLNLKTDYPRKHIKSFRGNQISTQLNAQIRDGVKGLAIELKATEYNVLLAIFVYLLNRYSNQDEISVGTPVANRMHSQLQNMIGMFVNTLVIKCKIESSWTVKELIKHIKEKCFDAFDNQEYPFENLVERVVKSREVSRNPLFDVMFVLQNNSNVEVKLGEAKLNPIDVENKVSKFDLTLSIDEAEQGYRLNWEYCVDLFDKETILWMAEHYNQILIDCINNPNKQLEQINMVSNSEEEMLLNKFNTSSAEYPYDKTFIELFEEQVRRTPNNIALEYQEGNLTYQQLNDRANYIGEILRKRGIKDEDIVAIMVDRSLEMIIALYGVLKSGAAYMPIDPSCPEDRLKYMIMESGAKIVLSTGKNERIKDIEVIDLLECNGTQEKNLEIISTANSLAYIIFTSGSTGKPKGVSLENKGLVNLCYWFMEDGQYTSDSIILQNFNYIFDGSVPEIFSPALAGSKLLILSDEQRKNPAEMIKVLPGAQITMVPSMFRSLLDYVMIYGKGESIIAADKIYLAAETITQDLLDDYKKINGSQMNLLANNYGPTEATVCTTSYRFKEENGIYKIPIGKPIANTEIYILNGIQLVGIGVPGELCIGGVGVARGYLNRDELTAEKFIENPYKKGERIYRTGDMARWLEDGNIEYLGRIDQQVKIRGFRVELGEIETQLRNIQNIYDSAVVVCEKDNNSFLCAYVVGKEGINYGVVKEKLSESLPEYMIPSCFMQLEELPTTSTGKLDKKSLPEPKFENVIEYVAPTNEIEAIVTEVFQACLGVEQVGIEDSFFEIGGNSLTATKVVNMLEHQFEIKIAVTDIFKYKVPKLIGKHIQTKSDKKSNMKMKKAREI